MRSPVTLLVAAVLVATACSPRDERSEAASSDKAATVTIHYYSANSSTWTDFGMSVLTLLFTPLVHEHGGAFEGRLARSRELSADGRTWTYHLRADARWHDDVPVTAHDVKFTIELFQNPEIKNPLAIQAGRHRSVEVLDDSTLTMTFTRYRNDFAWVGREIFLPKHLLEDLDPADFEEWDFWDHPVGNGPYRFSRMVPGQYIELVANPRYPLGEPRVQRVIVRVGGNATTELRAGTVDVVSEVGSVTAEHFAEDPRFRVFQAAKSRPRRVYWNHRHPILGDPIVRRALSLAIDRADLAAALNYTESMSIWDVPASPGQVRRREFPESLPHDLDRARELLVEAGWVDVDGDGIRERGGEELRLGLLGGGPYAVVFEAHLREVGVAIEIQSTDRDVWRQRFGEGSFDAAIGSALGIRSSPSSLLSGVPESIVGFESPELARLEAVLDTSFLEENRDRIYREAWPTFRETMPATLLLPTVVSTIAHRKIRGVSGRDGVTLLLHMDELWIEEDE
jgi:peptide/nickel transport system substrate-binding protein